ncbi:hypothetical protein HBI56_163560 [Parastagonospora nodorum]|uniref:Uncharacterized protein n=1 Tax=Phaeosphaeria nodorum (strain SN15 / ATCC MYA-4574 / FGSC 10173) TaxID=321614 RepID=A0A7U2NPN3_PHANO|nr:hypothetical protein HBH56_125840 [Parastagonospora nodorum]QRD05833.1 hypothetical protein JI435_304340 [Parastagonospora nodorum SN15]KAH3931323.1 hypothetical protein HBH54_097670 [Parastagonospora nodorum]KAH3944316.1 hypothetical protein HBH53_159150 [Parastagonospora nodorum]KAH3956233.1 hypothetical protein HBH51_246760 [Parastagonospora nodorum]
MVEELRTALATTRLNTDCEHKQSYTHHSAFQHSSVLTILFGDLEEWLDMLLHRDVLVNGLRRVQRLRAKQLRRKPDTNSPHKHPYKAQLFLQYTNVPSQLVFDWNPCS